VAHFAAVRVLGLDVGSRTIGVAVTDELGLCAHGVTTLQRRGTTSDVQEIKRLAGKYETASLVVGLPYDLEGQEGHRAKRVRVFIDALEQAGLAVQLWDERYTTVEAEQILLRADLSRKRRKAVIDKVAAQLILQGWLDSQRTNRDG
jgi:putative Holliday junction resolvase